MPTNDGYAGVSKRPLPRCSQQRSRRSSVDSGLAGRGGAGFPTGRKWSFIPKGVLPTYLVINADESEPGAFKDRELMERNPHQLLEGVAIAAYAIGCQKAFIYIRGEFLYIGEILDAAVAEAYAGGYLGQSVFGSGLQHRDRRASRGRRLHLR